MYVVNIYFLFEVECPINETTLVLLLLVPQARIEKMDRALADTDRKVGKLLSCENEIRDLWEKLDNYLRGYANRSTE